MTYSFDIILYLSIQQALVSSRIKTG